MGMEFPSFSFNEPTPAVGMLDMVFGPVVLRNLALVARRFNDRMGDTRVARQTAATLADPICAPLLHAEMIIERAKLRN